MSDTRDRQLGDAYDVIATLVRACEQALLLHDNEHVEPIPNAPRHGEVADALKHALAKGKGWGDAQ